MQHQARQGTLQAVTYPACDVRCVHLLIVHLKMWSVCLNRRQGLSLRHASVFWIAAAVPNNSVSRILVNSTLIYIYFIGDGGNVTVSWNKYYDCGLCGRFLLPSAGHSSIVTRSCTLPSIFCAAKVQTSIAAYFTPTFSLCF